MKKNNGDGLFDDAIQKQRKALKYFMGGSAYRKELPDKEDAVASAA